LQRRSQMCRPADAVRNRLQLPRSASPQHRSGE
jgi:hypothetical protein